MDESIEYKCPACGAPLHYSPKDEAISCDYCQSTFAISELNSLNENEESDKAFEWGDYKKHLSGEKLEGTRIYECQSCGAAIETDATTMALVCPYCRNNVVIKDNASAGLRPNKIIPFKVTKDKLPGVLKAFYNKKRLLPKDFFEKNKVGKENGIYIPYWLFDSTVSGSVEFHGEKTRYYRDGSYDCKQTQIYSIKEQGTMAFAKLPVDASLKMDNDIMDSLEPFDFDSLTDFDKSYLAGYCADRFDRSPDDELQRAQNRMLTKSESLFRSSVTKYSNVKLLHNNLSLVNPSVIYAMLPVYMFDCEYEGKTYHYAVNGQTGKIVGELPISKKRERFFFFLSFSIAFFTVFAASIIMQLIM